MSAQDKTEQVLRDIHILFAQSEVYDAATNRVIVDKREALILLNRLNVCIYEIMEEHEMTKQGRAAAERELRKRTDEIVADANRMAEDVYAGSVLYTDEALCRVQDIMQEAADSVKGIYEKLNAELAKEKAVVRKDQSELKSHLTGLKDTDKYLKLIEERNRQMQKEKAKDKKSQEQQASSFAPVKPEIKINTEYFEKAGIPIAEEIAEEMPEEKTEDIPVEIKVNLDAEYFRWKGDALEGEPDGKKAGKHSILGKILKGD